MKTANGHGIAQTERLAHLAREYCVVFGHPNVDIPALFDSPDKLGLIQTWYNGNSLLIEMIGGVKHIDIHFERISAPQSELKENDIVMLYHAHSASHCFYLKCIAQPAIKHMIDVLAEEE